MSPTNLPDALSANLRQFKVSEESLVLIENFHQTMSREELGSISWARKYAQKISDQGTTLYTRQLWADSKRAFIYEELSCQGVQVARAYPFLVQNPPSNPLRKIFFSVSGALQHAKVFFRSRL